MFSFFLLKPTFYSVFSKDAKFKETQNRNKYAICEHNCANCSCPDVRFCFCIFHFLFLEFPVFFQRCFMISSQKSNKITKYQSNKTKTKTTTTATTTTTREQYAKQNKSHIMIQDKTRQQAEKQNLKNVLKQKTNNTKRKSKNQIQK